MRYGVFGAVAGLAGCGSFGVEQPPAMAEIRFVQLSPGAPALDLYLNGAGAAYSVGYANYTSYLSVASGPLLLAADRVGSGQTLATLQGAVAGGHRYTAVLSHGLGSPQTHMYEDLAELPPSGEFGIRVLNAMDGPGALTVHIAPVEEDGAPAASMMFNLMSGRASHYVLLPAAGSYVVSAAIGTGGLRFPLSRVTLRSRSGTARTVVFGGSAGAGAHGTVGFALSDEAY